MCLRRSPVRAIWRAERLATAHGLAIPVDWLEMHGLARGDPEEWIRLALQVRERGWPLDLKLLAAYQLAGGDPLAAYAAALAQPHAQMPLGLLRQRAEEDTEARLVLATRLVSLYKSTPQAFRGAFADPRVSEVLGANPDPSIARHRHQLAQEIRGLLAKLPPSMREAVPALPADA